MSQISVNSYAQEGRRGMVSLIRPMPRVGPDETIAVVVVVSGSILEVFVRETTALVTRIYDHVGAATGLFLEDGSGWFREIAVGELPEKTW